MKVEELVIGGRYRFPVNSVIGYEEYYYTGNTQTNPNGGLYYCFEGAAWCTGYHWFDTNDIETMKYLETDWWRSMVWTEKVKKQENK